MDRMKQYSWSPAMRYYWKLIPFLGAIVFSALYIIAAIHYPGGSSRDLHSTGFSLLDNYWCNLLNEKALNGLPNGSRPYAVAAMLVLSCSLLFFWWQFAAIVYWRKPVKQGIQICGTLSSCCMLFLPFGNHDLVINLSALFGGIALVLVIIALRRMNMVNLYRTGLFNLVLIGINNIVYYSEKMLWMLPLVQKISFLFFICWIALTSLVIFKKSFPGV